MIPLFATCARGVEEVLAAELCARGAREVAPGRGGVAFAGEIEDCWRANLWLRTANHVLYRMGGFEAPDGAALYEGARAIPWHEHLTPRMTFAVDCTRSGGPAGLTHTHFAALKVKDAIADALRKRTGTRPSVDTRAPDVRVRVHLEGTACTVYLDASGESLHRRGYRPRGAEAPLKETLAAAILLLAGWDGTTPLCDPMCGSGTLVVEAALLARNLAPGLGRRFGFETWRGFDAARFAVIREAARAAAHRAPALIAGSDRDAGALERARTSARRAGVARDIGLSRVSLEDARPPGPPPGVVVCNPPYGERLGDARRLGALYGSLGTALKRRFTGYTAFVLTANLEAAKSIGLSPSRRFVLYNGPLECRLLRYELYAGARRR